ncbi:MAG TPA: hypothetical protein VF911_04475 [Thermoanaerobaculia bacterium]
MDTSRLCATLGPLLQDLERALGEIERATDSADEQFWARVLPRLMFATVEATTYELKRLVLEAFAEGQLSLSEDEVAVLRDTVPDVGSEGQITQRPRFIEPKRSLRLVFSLLVRMFGPDVALQTDDHRFASFARALGVRNRLTHPKGPTDVIIARQEIADMLLAFMWFQESLSVLLCKCDPTLEDLDLDDD